MAQRGFGIGRAVEGDKDAPVATHLIGFGQVNERCLRHFERRATGAGEPALPPPSKDRRSASRSGAVYDCHQMMTSAGDKGIRAAKKPRDSAATRQGLLRAGRVLFEEVGFEQATTREIGLRAGVDPALIARYFGGKEGLFLAAIAEGALDSSLEEIDFDPAALVSFLLKRWDEQGPSPISRALASPQLGDRVRAQIETVVAERLVQPLVHEVRRGHGTASRLQAELLIAAILGIALTRANGTLPGIAEAEREDLVSAMRPLIDATSGSRD
ncbi:MAG: TetR/AcrR family transcriptional regulator [Solirubrobacterales bacterium]